MLVFAPQTKVRKSHLKGETKTKKFTRYGPPTQFPNYMNDVTKITLMGRISTIRTSQWRFSWSSLQSTIDLCPYFSPSSYKSSSESACATVIQIVPFYERSSSRINLQQYQIQIHIRFNLVRHPCKLHFLSISAINKDSTTIPTTNTYSYQSCSI
jgi:hypothetical protein